MTSIQRSAVASRALSLPVAMNDDGTWPDQLAGDGLWTGRLDGVSLPEAHFLVDFLPARIDSPPGIGDAYPRLRIHQPAPPLR